MEAGLLQSLIQSCIEISPIGFIFGGIAMMYESLVMLKIKTM